MSFKGMVCISSLPIMASWQSAKIYCEDGKQDSKKESKEETQGGQEGAEQGREGRRRARRIARMQARKLNEPNGLPDPTLLTGKGSSLSEFVGLPFNIRPPSWTYTGQLKDTLWSHKKVDIIGTFDQSGPFPARFTETFQMEGEADLQLRGYSGFKIQHPN